LGSIVEVLHAGSLIVDDIEDASTSRRGRPALHLSHGLPLALNAGNWLYFMAYGLVEQLGLGPHVELNLYRCLSRCMARCHEGQALDLSIRMGRLSQAEVPLVVETSTRLKTGALMALSAVIPAVAAGVSTRVLSAFHDFGEQLGIGLQMLDDLDGLVSERRCHKGHEDLIHGRPTWPWGWLAAELHTADYTRLQQLARSVEARATHPELLAQEIRAALGSTPKRRVLRHLAQAERMVPRDIPGAHGAAELERELQRLVGSYA
jgi:geranylgeranyl pyrophosphate synthase